MELMALIEWIGNGLGGLAVGIILIIFSIFVFSLGQKSLLSSLLVFRDQIKSIQERIEVIENKMGSIKYSQEKLDKLYEHLGCEYKERDPKYVELKKL